MNSQLSHLRTTTPSRVLLFVLVTMVTLAACKDEDTMMPTTADPLLSSLEAYYKFNGTADDETSNNHDGMLLGGASVASGTLVTGYNDVDRLELPEAVMNGVGNFSIAGWVKINTFHPNPNQWVSCAIAAEDNNLGIWYDPANDRWSIDILSNRLNFPTNAAMEDNQFHHIALTRSGTTMSLYVDGVFVGSLTVPDAPITIDPGGFIIGQDQDSVGGGFSTNNSLAGEVDELRVYHRALTASEVASIEQLGR